MRSTQFLFQFTKFAGDPSQIVLELNEMSTLFNWAFFMRAIYLDHAANRKRTRTLSPRRRAPDITQ